MYCRGKSKIFGQSTLCEGLRETNSSLTGNHLVAILIRNYALSGCGQEGPIRRRMGIGTVKDGEFYDNFVGC